MTSTAEAKTDRQRIIPLIRSFHAGYFPSFTLTAPNLNTLADSLTGVDDDTLAAVFTELGRTQRFFPSVSEILEVAAERSLDLPDPTTAWISDHPLVEEARRLVGDSWYWKTTAETTLRSALIRAYTPLRAQAIRDFQVRGGA